MNSQTQSAERPEDKTTTETPQSGILSGIKSIFARDKGATADSTEPPEQVPNVNSSDSAYLQRNVQKLHQTRLSEISIPQADIVAVNENASLEQIFEVFRAHGYSRMPVYEENLDNPVGLIHIKDILFENGFAAPKADFKIKPFIRPLLYVPPSMRLAVLLQRMQTDHIHMALIIDEYGGVDGLLTIEDLLEQIVGDITDEHDEQEAKMWDLEAEGIYIAQSRAPLSEFMSDTGFQMQLPDTEEEIDTLGGLAFYLAARIPAKGEVIRTMDGYDIEIVDADPRRIKRIRVRNPQAADKATPQAAAKTGR